MPSRNDPVSDFKVPYAAWRKQMRKSAPSVPGTSNAITKCIIDNGNLLAAGRPSGVRWIDQLPEWVGSLTSLGGTKCFQDSAERLVPPYWRLP